MTDTIKILGQSAPSATSETALYTVPSAKVAIVSSVVICNRSATRTTFRLSIDQGGGGTGNADYLYYDMPISGNDTFIATIGITLATTDIVYVYAGAATLSFSAFGLERS